MDTNDVIRDWAFNLRLAGLFLQTIDPPQLRETGFKWLERVKSMDETEFKALRAHILKLLLISVQNNRLVGPFKRDPPKSDETLQAMLCEYKSSQIAKKVRDESLAELLNSEPMPPLPVSTGCYTVLQLIPKYGGHFYDSSSGVAIKNVNDLKKRDLPIGAAYIFPAYCTRNLYYPEHENGGMGRLLGRITPR